MLFNLVTSVEQHEDSLCTAASLVDENPLESLNLLKKITDPQNLHYDAYMQYVVTLTQARYMNDQDITNDTTIFQAQRYFTNQKKTEFAAKASYYSACIYGDLEMHEQELLYCLQALEESEKADNKLFAAKSAHRISSIYFD